MLVKKHNQTAVKADIAIVQDDEDKRLVTGEVMTDGELYKVGETIIFGKYALYKLTIQSEDYYLLDEEDVIGICNYKENV